MILLRRAAVVRRGPGLIGTMARTAVIAGTATAVSRGVSNRMDRSAEAKQQEQQAEMQNQIQAAQAQSAQAAMTTNPGTDLTAKLQELADLKSKSVLTEEEFTQAKKRLLGG